MGRVHIRGSQNIVCTGNNARIVQSRGLSQVGKFLIDTNNREVHIGHEVVPFHEDMTGNNIVAVNSHLIVDNFKLMPDNTWKSLKPTPKGLWTRFVNWLKGV